jgi:hypothetical protein
MIENSMKTNPGNTMALNSHHIWSIASAQNQTTMLHIQLKRAQTRLNSQLITP